MSKSLLLLLSFDVTKFSSSLALHKKSSVIVLGTKLISNAKVDRIYEMKEVT